MWSCRIYTGMWNDFVYSHELQSWSWNVFLEAWWNKEFDVTLIGVVIFAIVLHMLLAIAIAYQLFYKRYKQIHAILWCTYTYPAFIAFNTKMIPSCLHIQSFSRIFMKITWCVTFFTKTLSWWHTNIYLCSKGNFQMACENYRAGKHLHVKTVGTAGFIIG